MADLPSLNLVRRLTDQHVLDALLASRQLTRAELAARTGISKPTISESVRRLTDAGLLVEAGAQVGSRGRAGTYYRIDPGLGVVLTASAGPDGVVVEVDELSRTPVARQSRPVPTPITEAQLGPILVAAIDAALTVGTPVLAATVSLAGPVDQDTGRLVALPDAPFVLGELDPRALLGDRLGPTLRIDNDVNWAALAEYRQGAATHLEHFAYCYLGPGLGAGLVQDGAVLHGARGLSGEISHVRTTGPGGRLDPTQVPSTLTIDDLQPHVLAKLKPVSGNHGNLVFAAAPTRESNGRLVIVVLTQRANAGLGYSVRYFFLAAAATLLLGLAVALVLGRKLTRRLRDASVATQRIAAGQLATRVPEPRPDAHDELAELARSINGMAEGLQRSKVLEQQFLLSVSHDLRTPLTSIRGYAEAITDGAADPAAAATVIKSESQRLERLVADLLDLAKVQSRSFSFQMVPVNLVEATAAVVSGFVPGAAEHGLSLRFAVAVDGAGGSPVGQAPSPARSATMVTADPDRLAQVTSNLIENAIKYARFEVTVQVAIDESGPVVIVDDDGPGIPAVDLPYVFERLYVASHRPVRTEISSGLGLAIVRELVEGMGGTVGAGIAGSGGARLWFRLPPAPA